MYGPDQSEEEEEEEEEEEGGDNEGEDEVRLSPTGSQRSLTHFQQPKEEEEEEVYDSSPQ